MKRTHLTGSALIAGFLVLAGCGPRLAPVVRSGGMIPDSEAVIQQARVEGERERSRQAEQRAAVSAAALESCAPAICESIAKGELALGMTESQLLAATRTTGEAWERRLGGFVTSMTPLAGESAPRDAIGPLAHVSLRDGRVTSYTYREPSGFRTVATPGDATLAGRAAAQADAMLEEGDRYALAGRLDLALDRYDRADVVRPNHPATTQRIAGTLDKQLRPIEAILRYQLFIHQLELERIHARGEAAARMAEAIALAQQRIIVLDRR